MKVVEKSKFYKVKLLWYRIRHGLFLFTLRNALLRIGIDIEPYYWFKEVKNGCDEPKIPDSFKDYEMVYLELEDVLIMDNNMGLNSNQLKLDMKRGQLCIGLKRENEIATLLFVELEDFVFKKRTFTLKDNEGYLLNVYTFQAYRGKNLAPFLRHHCYKLLEEHGINHLYSIITYFNSSSLKVNKKLNAKKLNLYLYIGLFKKRHWNYLLKDYSK
ncbi:MULTISPECIES: hypothetical protein [Aquimarina]|uniref:hypothetical protein n=1 Tax=Aquimarina TaxID=290174 RepID=UPI00040D115F|nr:MULTISPECIES: hypothetical protein [Aquimarina]